jgi:hypothetical protein
VGGRRGPSGVAYWVEVAEDMSLDARGQIAQVLAQIDATLGMIQSNRTALPERPPHPDDSPAIRTEEDDSSDKTPLQRWSVLSADGWPVLKS